MNWIKRLFHKHRWTYHGYVPTYGYIPGNPKRYPRHLWGTAQSRVCDTCGIKDTTWKVR